MADDLGDIVFLEEANSGDARGSGLEAGGRCLRAGDGSFFEDRGEEGEVGSCDIGLLNLRGLVTRLADGAAGGGARAT